MPDPVATTSETELLTRVGSALGTAYELEREIGRGGMGIVYRARDRRLKRPVAIKILPPEMAFRSEIRSRFLREAETAAQLNHPHIVPIYSVDEADGIVYFVMACVDGDNLGKRLHDRGPLPIDDVRQILTEVADALAYAHGRGVVHRDIKPDNILLDPQGRALVTDFGIARAVIEGNDSRLTATGMAIGTPAYMSPEQSAGDREIDGRSDLYALGIVAYQMLSGELPFVASSPAAMLVKHLSEVPAPVDQRRADVPADLTAIVMRLLEKEPDQRFASAGELEAALRGEYVPPAAFNGTTRPAKVDVGSVARRPESVPAADDPDAEYYVPTDVETARWQAYQVTDFRRKLAPYLIVNSVIVLLALFTGKDWLSLTALWSVFIAFKYARLWADGFDWRDVFKQPRDRLFFDVVAEAADDATALFDRDKRAKLRERARARRLRGRDAWNAPALPRGSYSANPPYGAPAYGAPGYGQAPYRGYAVPSTRPGAPPGAPPDAGPHGDAMREADADRAEIERLVQTMPPGERKQIPDVLPSANALASRIRELATTLATLEREVTPNAAAAIEVEITRLEAAANPLDRVASEERVKRLAQLKRQRRAAADLMRRRDLAADRLESCRLALRNMRLDVVRMRTGGGVSIGQVTTLAERAMVLAREVDGVIAAADEVGRVAPRDAGARARR